MSSTPQNQPPSAPAGTLGKPHHARPRPLDSIHIVMLGLMGSGKTVVGRMIAAELGWRLSDNDQVIVEAVGLSARTIKERRGVRALHQFEAAHLLDALAVPAPSVICAAASVVDSPACRAALREPSACPVWLRARSDTLAARFYREDHRPAYGEHPAAFFEDQIAARTPHMTDVAALSVDVDEMPVPEVAAHVIALVRAHVSTEPPR